MASESSIGFLIHRCGLRRPRLSLARLAGWRISSLDSVMDNGGEVDHQTEFWSIRMGKRSPNTRSSAPERGRTPIEATARLQGRPQTSYQQQIEDPLGIAQTTAAEKADSGRIPPVCNLGRKVIALRCARDAGDFHHDTGSANRGIASRRTTPGERR